LALNALFWRPLGKDRAFLALAPGKSVSDLELAVIDRLSPATDTGERDALDHVRRQLRIWRQDTTFEFHTRAIIVVESFASKRVKGRRRPAATARETGSGLREPRSV
jgi:hypothetical protein